MYDLLPFQSSTLVPSPSRNYPTCRRRARLLGTSVWLASSRRVWASTLRAHAVVIGMVGTRVEAPVPDYSAFRAERFAHPLHACHHHSNNPVHRNRHIYVALSCGVRGILVILAGVYIDMSRCRGASTLRARARIGRPVASGAWVQVIPGLSCAECSRPVILVVLARSFVATRGRGASHHA